MAHNRDQARVEAGSREWQACLEWFKELPLFVELGRLRVVHATWDPAAIRLVRGHSFHDEDFLRRSATEGSPVFGAVETLLKGPEIPLPSGFCKQDKEGIKRADMRVAWWKPRTREGRYSYKDLAVPGARELPDAPVPPEDLAQCATYGRAEKPVIFGHYWLSDDAPAPLTSNAGCVDYSVAKAGGRLVAYTWHGEPTLKPAHFTSVSRTS